VKRSALPWLVGGLILVCALCASAVEAAAEATPLHVLFIGNSFVYYNNSPAMLAALATAAGRPLSTTMVVEGGASLEDHWKKGEALAAIRSGHWDYVVLNDQSTFGQVFLVRGRYRVGGDDELLRYGAEFTRAAREAGAATILLCHWKDLGAPGEDQVAIDRACQEFSRETGARTVLAGAAFSSVLRSHPSLHLYDPDAHHPSAAGSYLVAALLTGAIVGRSPTGGPATIRGHAVDEDTGREAEEISTLVELPEETARLLQERAWRIASRATATPSPAPGMPALELPTVPRGRPIALLELVGRWTGPIDLYPWPGVLTVQLSSEGDKVGVAGTITFGGRPRDIALAPTEVTFDGSRLSWVDPHGPNGSRVTYTATFDGTRLRGVAEMTASDDSIYGIGEWTMSRDPR